MSTGLLLFLVFMALSIIDSVARARRGQQQKVLPPEDEGDEEWRAEPSPAQAEEGRAQKREPGEALGELVGLEKLMGPGYLEKLMGPGIAAVMQDEEDAPQDPAPDPAAAVPDERRGSSLDRDERRAIARDRRSSDQERRRGEARGRSRVERVPSPGGRRVAQGSQSDGDRRLRGRRDDRSRPAAAVRARAPLRDSTVDRDRDGPVPMPGRPPGAKRRSPRRTRLYRELFGGGDQDSLRRAFVLKEILDAPASERPPDRRDAG
jgi:hypothetical protein